MKIFYSLVNFDGGPLSSPTPDVVETDQSVLFRYPCSDNKCYPYKVHLLPGSYVFESWGASGIKQVPKTHTGRGGYTRGTIRLPNEKDFYLLIGYNGWFNGQPLPTTYNLLGHPGGGASDARLSIQNSWDDFSSLKSRIMVAGGGGGIEWSGGIGGDAGGLAGSTGYGGQTVTDPGSWATGGSQTSGGEFSCNLYDGYERCGFAGSFGRAGFVMDANDLGGGGGGGYFGGGSRDYTSGGGGGSSFISGHKGCIALDISKSTDFTHLEFKNSSYHDSGFYFSSTMMIPGNSSMPDPEDPAKSMIGNEGKGFFKISVVPTNFFSVKNNRFRNGKFFLASFLFFLRIN